MTQLYLIALTYFDSNGLGQVVSYDQNQKNLAFDPVFLGKDAKIGKPKICKSDIT